MGGDGRGQIGRSGLDEVHGGFRGDVFEHHRQPRKLLDQAFEFAVDEFGLAVEDIDLVVGDLAVHQQRQADLFHGRDHMIDPSEIGNA